jgi:hypothetical protein
MNNSEIYRLAFSHCRSTSILNDTLNSYVVIENYRGKSFEEIYPNIEFIFSKINGLGKLCIIDVTLDIMRYYCITDDRKFIVGSGDLQGIEKLGLSGFVKTIRVGNSNLKYIKKVYISAAMN